MYVTIKTYTDRPKADFLMHRLELAEIDCQIIPLDEPEKSFKIEVKQTDVEIAVEEILKIQIEYPNEEHEVILNPSEMARILIPIDFSEKSLEACKYAIGLAEKMPVEIKLLYVWNDEHFDQLAVMHSQSMEEFKRIERIQFKQELDNKMEAFGSQLHQLISDLGVKNVLFHFTVNEGIPKIQIAQSIKKYQPLIVFVAHNDKKNYEGRITQQLATDIMDMALCPVIYIPMKAKFTTTFEGIDIMYATNFDSNADRSLKKLIKLFTPFNLDLHCIHIATDETEAESKIRMNALVDELQKGEHALCKISGNVLVVKNLVKGLDAFMEEKGVDIVAFTSPAYSTWHKMFQPDNRKKMMLGGKLPMLIFKYKD